MQVSDILRVIERLPKGTLKAIYEMLCAVVQSSDPRGTAERAAIAIASKTASEAVIKKTLKKRAK